MRLLMSVKTATYLLYLQSDLICKSGCQCYRAMLKLTSKEQSLQTAALVRYSPAIVTY